MLPHLLAAVVRSVVQEPVGVLPPVLIFAGQSSAQVRHKHEHDIRVSVALRETHVKVAFGVDCCNHVHTMSELPVGECITLASLSPLFAAEVKTGEP